MSLIRTAKEEDCFVAKASNSDGVTLDIFDMKGNKIGEYVN